MKQLIQGIMQLGVLAAISVGCTPLKSQIRSIKVDSVALSEAGVELKAVPTAPYTVPIDDTVYPTSVSTVSTTSTAVVNTLAAPVAMDTIAVSQNRLAAAAQIAVAPKDAIAVQPVIIPAAPSYLYVSNVEIGNALREHLSNFSQLADLYNSTVSNNRSISLVPQLNVVYQFKAQVGTTLTNSISFPLYEYFQGFGAIIHQKGTQFDVFWGKGILEKTQSNVKLASSSASPLIANIFDLSAKSEIFKSTDANFFVFEAVSGGNLFGITFTGNRFVLNYLATTLPVVANTQAIVSTRVNADLAAKLAVKLNGRLFYYQDTNSIVSHIYYLGSDFIFKELKDQCVPLATTGYVPAGMSCTATVSTATTAVSADVISVKSATVLAAPLTQ